MASAKDKYYFSHDYNARNDKKIWALVRDFKSAGYGIFWATCEMMHEEGGSIELDEMTIATIAKDINEAPTLVAEVLANCITKYKLFTKQENLLRSSRIQRNLDERGKSKQIKAEAGRKGGINSGKSRRNDLKTKQDEAERSSASSNEPKERKGKERKEEEIKGKESEGLPPPFNTFPVASDFNGLPERYSQMAVELIRITQRMTVELCDIESLWEVYKVQNLTGKNFKKDAEDVYSHFINWVKFQKISDGNQLKGPVSVGNPKRGTSEDRIQAAREFGRSAVEKLRNANPDKEG